MEPHIEPYVESAELTALLADLFPWIESELFDEIMQMRLYQDIFLSWNEMLDMTTDEVRSYGHYHRWVRQGYLAFMGMAVRREADTGEDARSLRRLLITIQDNAALLERGWYFQRVPESPAALATEYEQHWSEISTEDGKHLSGEFVATDIASLLKAAKKTKEWATSYIAHRLQDRDTTANPRYEEVHAAVDEIEELFRKWYLIITGKYLATIDPIQWEHVLTVPWINKKQASELTDHRRQGAK